MRLPQSLRSFVTASVTNSKLNATRKKYGFLLKSAVFGSIFSFFLKKIKKLKKIS